MRCGQEGEGGGGGLMGVGGLWLHGAASLRPERCAGLGMGGSEVRGGGADVGKR